MGIPPLFYGALLSYKPCDEHTDNPVAPFSVSDITEFRLFPSFEAGVGFMIEVAQRRLQPASVRLIDNEQFHMGHALKEEVGGSADRRQKPLPNALFLFPRGVRDLLIAACGLTAATTCEPFI